MIGLPELCIVLGVFALMGGYIVIIHRLFAQVDKESNLDSGSPKRSE